MPSQLVLTSAAFLLKHKTPSSGGDPWCSRGGDDLWDGVDFERCFRVKFFDGLLPLVFLSLSLSFAFFHALRIAYTLFTSNREGAIRLGESSTAAAAPAALSPIAQAESAVLKAAAEKQSPDWANPLTQRELLGVEAAEGAEEDAQAMGKEGGVKVYGRAVWGCKKDLVAVVCSAVILALVVVKAVRALKGREDGRAWVVVELVAWAWATVLVLVKLALTYSHRLFALQHPSLPHRDASPWSDTIERHLIPFYVVFSSLTAFFNARTALLDYYAFPVGPAREALKIEGALFGVSTFLFLVEIFAPRPSRFSSRSSRSTAFSPIEPNGLPLPPELNASLFSAATWTYMESFQLRSAFPRAYGVPTLKLDAVPDLRPDDKTARVLLAYRQSLAELDALLLRLPSFVRRRMLKNGEGGVDHLSLAWKLSYHFLPALVAQNTFALVRVALSGLPPLMLKGILNHIGRRNRGEPAPTHVAVLYAWVLFASTVVGSLGSSQSLFIGRRICIRLRSIIVGEVFTKALRRKDQAGSSSSATVPPSAAPTRPASPEPETEVVGEAEVVPNDSVAPTVVVKKQEEEEDKEELKKIEEELEKASSGKIMNLISIDTYRLSEICAYLHFLLSEMPLMIVVVLYLLYKLLGVSALAGVAVFLGIMPIQGWIGKLYNKFQLELLAAADQRLTLTTEVIGQVRIVKYFAWERKFLEKMDQARRKELAALWRRALATTFGGNLMFGTPVIVAVVTFTFHTKVMKEDLTAETAFTALALFNVLRTPLEGFTDMFVNVLQAFVSLGRIDEYLHEEETHKYSILAEAPSADMKIGIVNGTFTWANEDEARVDPTVFRIKDLNLKFPEGKLSIILGPVGSGKTTVLMSLLGETNRLSGSAYLPSPVIRTASTEPSILTETTAFAAQSPWLMSASIRENILFGSKFDRKRYQATLEACALVQDLKQFELADETEVGEKGTVLSGGQKARISLARAIYSPAKYVLLDDVLSAVDSHTAQHLVGNCLAGKLMKHRTCVLVTHAVDLCLPFAKYVVTLEHGVVVSAGAPDALPKDLLLELEKEQDEYAAKHQPHDEADPTASTIEAIADDETDAEAQQHHDEERKKRIEELKLVKDETSSEGAVKKEVYAHYLRSFGSPLVLLVTVLILVGAQFSDIAVNAALRYWASAFDNRESTSNGIFVSVLQNSAQRWHAVPAHIAGSIGIASLNGGNASATGIIEDHAYDPDFWLRMYCILALVNLTLITARVAFWLWRGLIASKKIYSELIRSILGARIRFFDSTPTGRILNRLSKDQETIDQDLAATSMYLTLEILMVMGIIGTISWGIPAFLPAAFVITCAYAFLGQVYLASSRELKRAESVTRSPIFSVFGEALQGVSTIRAYGDASRFMQQIFHLLDENNRPFFTIWLGNRWLSVRVDTAGAFVALMAALFIIFSPSMDAALAGFIMTFALAFNDRIIWVVRLWAQVEVQANSVERIQEYTQLGQESKGGVKPPAIWPTRGGTISVNGLTASYAPDLPPVLKNISFEVKGGEKIGIVGRTGSGKSTLGLSFFRFIEPTSGNITIDGLDINTLRLEDLRSRLTIVAQEAALFAGTLRFNLDPFEQHTDAEVWSSLQRVQMAAPGMTSAGPTPRPTPGPSRAASITSGSDDEGTATDEETERYVVKSLEMVVTEGGKNFSAGQRQLLALARGILKLKSSSILILDESTASLDHATDERIQTTIREEMADATILCIAHRLRTIIDYTRILVLDAGEVVEYDTPLNLLSREGSAFAGLCRKSGEFEVLREMAKKAGREGRK